MRPATFTHYLVGAQGALPVDAAGNPWTRLVYNSGNLALDLLDNLMLESTGRLQKCRIYEMTDDKTARSTIAYLYCARPGPRERVSPRPWKAWVWEGAADSQDQC